MCIFFTLIEPTVFQSSNICSYLQSLSNWESLHIVIQIFSIWYNLTIQSPFGGRGYSGLVAMGTHWVEHRGSHFLVKKSEEVSQEPHLGFHPSLFSALPQQSVIVRGARVNHWKINGKRDSGRLPWSHHLGRGKTLQWWPHNSPLPTPCKPSSLTGLSSWVSLGLLLWSLRPTWGAET